MTIGEFLIVYEKNHVAFLKNRLGTSRRLQKYVGQLAHVELHELKRMAVIDWFHRIAETEGPNGANLALQQLHALYARAQDWEVYPGTNPAAHIKKFPKRSRERFVLEQEMPYLMASLSEAIPRDEVYFLTLLLTGCRRDEARLMRWEHLDLSAALWHKPTTKTGTPHTVPLPWALLAKLQALPRLHAHVFCSRPNPMNGFQPGEWSVCAVERSW